jgi:hypothetical protein
MKVILSLLLLSVSAMAQMTQAGLLKLDRAFAQATSERRLNGWMSYMMEPSRFRTGIEWHILRHSN